jgi:hypothetical protein
MPLFSSFKSSLTLLFLRRELKVFSPFGKGGFRGIYTFRRWENGVLRQAPSFVILLCFGLR